MEPAQLHREITPDSCESGRHSFQTIDNMVPQKITGLKPEQITSTPHSSRGFGRALPPLQTS